MEKTQAAFSQVPSTDTFFPSKTNQPISQTHPSYDNNERADRNKPIVSSTSARRGAVVLNLRQVLALANPRERAAARNSCDRIMTTRSGYRNPDQPKSEAAVSALRLSQWRRQMGVGPLGPLVWLLDELLLIDVDTHKTQAAMQWMDTIQITAVGLAERRADSELRSATLSARTPQRFTFSAVRWPLLSFFSLLLMLILI